MNVEQPKHAPVQKPVKRSTLRRQVGRQFYILKRKWQWYFSGTTFAQLDPDTTLPVVIHQHQTPLLRKLKSVDMWMQHNKVANLKIAQKKLDGLMLKPGETFSYWRALGKPTKSKGYLPGMQLDQGSFKAATGGGLCQMSNLIFWMAMHTPLTIVERWRHSYDVFPDANRTQPFGSGATCAYNYIDLQLRNDTDQAFQLRISLSDSHLHGEWRAERPINVNYEIFESDHLFRQEYWGYTRHNRIGRHAKHPKTGEVLYTEPLIENHAIMMYNPLLEE